jgi:hypothetical protein
VDGIAMSVRQSFVDDLSRHDLIETVGRLRRALLILHAPTDTTVGIENATRLFVAAKHPKSFISLDTTDHLLTRPADAEFAAGTIAAWASRYFPDRRSDVMEPEPAAGAIAVETGAGPVPDPNSVSRRLPHRRRTRRDRRPEKRARSF